MTALVKIWKDHLVALHEDESGATMIEYSVLIGLITVLLIVTILTVGEQIQGAWEALTAALENLPAAGEGGG